MADNFLFLTGKKYYLDGSGITATATSIALKSFKTPDGTDITMADFGSIGYGTLEPGGEKVELISFTGITQNADDDGATLTGVTRGLKFRAPYDNDNALRQPHAGSAIFIISNTPQFYNGFPAKANDETITGKYTFPSGANRPVADTDVDTAIDAAFVTFGQLARQAIAGAANSSATVKGLVEMATQAEIDAGTASGGTGALLAIAPDTLAASIYGTRLPSAAQKSALASTTTPGASNLYHTQADFQKGTELYAASSGGTDAYAITLSPALAAYTTGQEIRFKADVANTGACTLNVNALGAKTIKKNVTQDLDDGDIPANAQVTVRYDGTNFQLQSVKANVGNKLAVFTTDVSIDNTEKTLLTGTLKGGTLGLAGVIKARIFISSISTDNSTRNYSVRLKLGATTIATATFAINTASWAQADTAWIDALIFNKGATNSQEGSVMMTMIGKNASSTPTPVVNSAVGTAAIDTTADATFSITIQSDNASATGTASHGVAEIIT